MAYCNCGEGGECPACTVEAGESAGYLCDHRDCSQCGRNWTDASAHAVATYELEHGGESPQDAYLYSREEVVAAFDRLRAAIAADTELASIRAAVARDRAQSPSREALAIARMLQEPGESAQGAASTATTSGLPGASKVAS